MAGLNTTLHQLEHPGCLRGPQANFQTSGCAIRLLKERGSFPTGMQHVNPNLFIELANISYAIALSLVHNLPVARNALERLFSAGSASLSPMASPIGDVLQAMERAVALLQEEDRELALARALAMLGGRDPDRSRQSRHSLAGSSTSAITARAIELFRRLTPKNPAYKVELAVCLTQNHRLAEAAMEYADLARVDSARFETMLHESVNRYIGTLVRVLLSGNGQLGDVVGVFRQTLERSPSSGASWLAERMSALASLAGSDRCRADPGSMAVDLHSLAKEARRKALPQGEPQ